MKNLWRIWLLKLLLLLLFDLQFSFFLFGTELQLESTLKTFCVCLTRNFRHWASEMTFVIVKFHFILKIWRNSVLCSREISFKGLELLLELSRELSWKVCVNKEWNSCISLALLLHNTVVKEMARKSVGLGFQLFHTIRTNLLMSFNTSHGYKTSLRELSITPTKMTLTLNEGQSFNEDDHLIQIPIGGDLLGRERIPGAKMLRKGCNQASERFVNISEVAEFWYAKQAFLNGSLCNPVKMKSIIYEFLTSATGKGGITYLVLFNYNHGQKSWGKFTFVALFHMCQTNSSTLVQPLPPYNVGHMYTLFHQSFNIVLGVGGEKQRILKQITVLF